MHLADINAPARGAYAELNTLIALRFPAAQLKLGRRKRALSKLAGPNKANFRGRGIDFEEVRTYQPGDDIRTIDWRVTARSGSAHTKLFREERERPVLVVVDQRSNMFFGSSHCFKSVLASQLASLLAWSALQAGDRVGGLVFNDLGHQEIRPRRSRKTVLALLSQIATYNSALPLGESAAPLDNAAAQGRFTQMLSNLRRIARPGSSLFLVSDFRGASEEHAREHLFELAKHTELTAVACADPLESELPRSGLYAVTNGSERSELYTGDQQLRRRYHTQLREQRELLRSDLLKLGVPLLQASTDQAPFALLQKYYGGCAPVNPQDPLANLQPLRQPELIGWWPPAIGWWILLCALVFAVGLLAYLLRKHYRKNAYRRRAALQLLELREAHRPGGDVSQYLGAINALLKSVALVAYPRTEVAAQHGAAWRQFLNRSLPPDAQLEPSFDTAMYQKNDAHIDLDRVQRAAQLWIKRHKAAP